MMLIATTAAVDWVGMSLRRQRCNSGVH